MNKLSLRSLPYAYLVVVALSVAWAYTSYKYNWLNVGGGEGDVDFWIIAGEIAAYSFLASWLALLVITAFGSKTVFLTFRGRILSWFFAIVLPVAVVSLADWFFHQGFPPPPPM